MNTQIIEPEVISPVESKLIKYAGETGLEKPATETLVEAFRPVFVKSRQALSDARGVAESVKDATCVTEIRKSRACRLAIRAVRLEGEAIHKKQKESALRFGRAVDGFRAILLADLAPVEQVLQDAENTAERAEAKRFAELKAAREAELVPLLDEPLLGNLADLSEVDYVKKLVNAKFLRQAKLDAAAKIESERLAKVEAERKERERLDAENAKLKAEAVAREAAAKAEREAAEKKLAAERAEAARVAREFQAKADAAAKVAAELAAKERTRIEAKAKAEADQARAEAEVARAALAAKVKAEADHVARVEADRKAVEKAFKAAAAAPDNAKLKAFAVELRTMARPKLSDRTIASALLTRLDQLAVWCEGMAKPEALL